MTHQIKWRASTGLIRLHGTYRCIALGLSLFLTLGAMAQARTQFISPAVQRSTVMQQGTASSSAAQAEQRTLEPGKPFERELAGGAIHVYSVALNSGEYLHVSVVQRGIDVIVALRGPDAAPLTEMDGLRGKLGIEELSWQAASTGSYILEVRAKAQSASTARYEVEVQKALVATQRDLARIAAERLFMEGVRAEAEGQEAGLDLAVVKYGEAVEEWIAIGERRWEEQTLLNLGGIYQRLGHREKAMDCYKQALVIGRDTGDRLGEGSALHGLGNVYWSLSQYDKARQHYEQALAIRREIKDRSGEGDSIHGLGGVYWSLSQHEKAQENYEQALVIRRETRNRLGEGATLNNLGNVYVSLSRYEKAREHFEQALAIMREIKNKLGEGQILNNLGEVCRNLGQYEKALDYYEQALAIRRETRNKDAEGQILSNLGSVYLSLSQYTKAREHYEQALEIRRGTSNRLGEGTTLSNLGAVYTKLGQYDQARDRLEQALAIMRTIKNREVEGQIHNNLGDVCQNLSQYEKAQDYYEQALLIRRAIGDGTGEAETLLALASLDRTRGNLSEARKRIESALAIIENLRATYTDQALRSVYFSTVQKYYEFYIDLLMRLHKQEPSAGHDAAALHVSERSHARSLLDLLAEAGADIRQGVDPQLLDSERSLQRQLNLKAQLQLKLHSGPHTEEQASAAAKEIEELTTEYQEVRARIRRSSPRYATLTQPVSLDLKEIQLLLDPNTLLLEYALGEERSYLWAVSQTAISSYELPKRAEIENSARRVYESFSTSNGTADKGYVEAMRALSQMLLAPVGAQLGKKRLLVVSDGAIQYLPFAALLTPPDSGTVSLGSRGRKASQPKTAGPMSPLIVDHEVVSLPSASLLAVLRRETNGRAPAPRMIVALADPVFDRNDLRVKPADGVLKDENLENHLQNSGHSSAPQLSPELERSARDAGGLSFERLRSSRDEAEEIVDLAREGESLKALDFKASRATALSDELGQYRIVHFATHGLLNSLHPELSGLVLSLVDEHGQPQDGFLRAHEIYNLKLGADLVVLSACQTALGKEIRGEGLDGLTRGFMYAGAPRVVASLWRVPSKATAELMKRFYRGMLVAGMRPAAALRAAQLAMLKEKRWNEPYYWAAFVLQGDWQ